MTYDADVKPWIDIATAAGTVAVAGLAIWGEKLRAAMYPARLEIEGLNQPALGVVLTVTSVQQGIAPSVERTRVVWHTSKVVNKRKWLRSEHCRVMLVGISRRDTDGQYRPEQFTVPRQFCWAPSETSPAEVTILRDRAFDLGHLVEGGEQFRPTLYSMPAGFPGFVGKMESVRYFIQIEADDYCSPQPHVIQISWDGEWHDNAETMRRHLIITEIGRGES